jgi:hypothetical protein
MLQHVKTITIKRKCNLSKEKEQTRAVKKFIYIIAMSLLLHIVMEG